MAKVQERRTLRLLVVALSVGALALAGGALAIRASFPPERLTPLVRAQLSRHLAAPVSLRRAEIRIFPALSVHLEDIVIGDPRGYRRPASWPRGGLVGARIADGTLALGPLLSRKIEIEGVRLEDASLTAIRNEQGVGNWEGLGGTHATEPTPGTDRFDLAVRRLELKRAKIQVYDARDGMYLAARRIDTTLALLRTAGGKNERVRFRAEVQGVGGRTAWPLGERPIRLEADIEHGREGQRWRVKKAGLARGRLALSGSGTIDGPEQVVDFKLDQSTLPLSDLLELLPADQVEQLGRLTGSGTIRLAGQARGPTTRGRAPAIRARATMSGGRLAFKNRPLALEGLSFDLRATEHGADLAALTGRLGRSTFQVKGLSRGWADPRVRAHILAAADLADLSRFLPLADSARLAGRARIVVDGAGRIASGAASDFGWSGRVDLVGVTASGVGAGRPIEGVSGTIGLAPGHAWATALTARVGKSDLTLDGTVDRPLEWFAAATGRAKGAPAGAVARVAIKSRRLDLDELLPAEQGKTPLPPVRVEGTFEVGSLHLRKLDAEHARGRFTYGHGVTAIDEFALDAYGGSSSGRAWLDFRDRAKPHYQLAATARDMDANAVVTAWTKAKDVAYGKLQMTIDLDGTGLTGTDVARGLTVKGLAQVLGGRLAGATVFAKLAEFTGVDRFRILSFRDLSAPFRIASGRVIFDPLALATDHTDWLARGSVGLDGTLDFALVAVVPPSDVPQLPRNLLTTAGALMNSDGRLTLDLRLGGTVRRPTLAWDSNRTASRFLENSGLLVDLLAKQLGVSLGDSLAQGASLEEAADRILEQQQRKLEQEVERRTEDLATKAIEELTELFEKKASPPPPPAAPPDSTSSEATSTAPPPPPEPLPAALDSSTVPAAPPGSPAPAPAPPDTSRAPADTALVP